MGLFICVQSLLLIEGPAPANAPHSQGAAEQQTTTVESRAQSLSGLNGLVCDIAVNGTQMCGKTYHNQSIFRYPLRTLHPGYTLSRDRRHLSIDEKIAGENVLKKWVRDGHCRNARYLCEPPRVHNESLIYQYATACERIASEDNHFAKKFGRQFHRQSFRPQIWPGRKVTSIH